MEHFGKWARDSAQNNASPRLRCVEGIFVEECRLLGCDAGTLVRTDVSEKRITSIIRATRIGELETTIAMKLRLPVTANVVPSSSILVAYDGGDTFLRNVDSNKS
jgi:hypothetical protein